VIVDRLRQEWHARERSVGVEDFPIFMTEGLVVGARTMLVPSEADRCLKALDGQEARVLALLSAAYRRPISPSVLGWIERAGDCWRQGEDCLALIHLALAGLHRLEDHREAARRVFMADGLMKAGVPPSAILRALDFDPTVVETLERYSQDQPRVAAGNGRTSGQWTKFESVLTKLSVAAARFLMRLSLNRVVTTGTHALAENPYALALGLILVPRTTNPIVKGEVAELPGLRYAWNRQEAVLRIAYAGPHGNRDIDAMLGADGEFRDGQNVVARLLPDQTLVIDPGAVSSDLADKDGPNLCPKPEKDKPGRTGAKGDWDKAYEDQIKALINPDNPTPRGYGYAFYNPNSGKFVLIDDCQHSTGDVFEIKRDYSDLLDEEWGKESLTYKWLDQSKRQVDATQGRLLFWIFSQRDAADFARKLFIDTKDDRVKITIYVIPRTGG
jgi:hypothetical protein